ncbi:hypothetical protein Tco_1169319 [Tanacetum coccineum]
MRPSHHLCSLVPSVHRLSVISERPSHDSSSASLSCKRSRSHVASVPLSSPTLGALSYARADLLPSPKRIRKAGLGVDFEDESSEPSRSRGTDLEIDVDVERSDGIQIDPEVQVIESVQRDQGHRIVATGQQSANMLERIGELERDNRRLRDIVDVESQKVTRFRRSELHMQMELRQIRRFRFYDRMRIARLKAYARSHFSYHSYIVSTMPNTRSGASRTREGVNEQSDRRMAEALRVRDTVRNLGPLMGDEGEQEVNGNRGNGNGGNGKGGNRNGGNGNGNGNGGEYGYNFRGFMPASDALTWWNSHKRTIGIEAAYAMSWTEIMKLMTEVYCPRNKELVLLCTRMVPNEEDKVERFVGGLPDNIQGNVITVEPTKLQDAIRVANNLMDEGIC